VIFKVKEQDFEL